MAHDMLASEIQTYESLYENKGARIMFHCDSVTYQGIINDIILDTRRVKLRHVKTVEDDRYYGNLNFKFREIAHFKVIESAKDVNRIPKNEYLQKILKNNRPVKSDVIVKALYGDRLSDESEDETPEENTVENTFVLDWPKHLEHKLPKNYAVMDVIDEDFDQAIESISKQQIIGVSFHAPVISRFGKLNWICISTNVYLFLFDIQKLEKEAFDKGLRQVFENKFIKKVIHDCSYPSDCLLHCYATRLTNVFDTRVADYIVHVQRYNDKYEFHPFSTLDCCLRTYLKVPQDFLHKRETSESRSHVFQRPISNDYLYDLLKTVVYLKLLQEELSKEMLAPIFNATGFYRTVLAKSTQELIDLLGNDLSRPDRMIQSLLMYGIQAVRFEGSQHKSVPLSCALFNPQSREVIRPNLALPVAVKNYPTSSDKRKESAVKEAHSLLVNPKPEKAIKPYLGSLAAVKSAVLQSIEEKKKDPTSSDKQNQSVANEYHCQLEYPKPEKVIKPYLGSLAAVKSDFFRSIEEKKKSLVAEEADEDEATTSTAKSGFLHINKIYYHTSISEMFPGRLGNIDNLKPIDHISKFSDKQPLSCFDDSLKSSLNASDDKSDSNCNVLSETSSSSNQEFGDIWLKLREESIAERDAASVHCKEKKISFIPG